MNSRDALNSMGSQTIGSTTFSQAHLSSLGAVPLGKALLVITAGLNGARSSDASGGDSRLVDGGVTGMLFVHLWRHHLLILSVHGILLRIGYQGLLIVFRSSLRGESVVNIGSPSESRCFASKFASAKMTQSGINYQKDCSKCASSGLLSVKRFSCVRTSNLARSPTSVLPICTLLSSCWEIKGQQLDSQLLWHALWSTNFRGAGVSLLAMWSRQFCNRK